MKPWKIVLLVATLWVTFCTAGTLSDVNLGNAVNWATSILWLVLSVGYVIHVWGNKSFVLTASKRVLWTLAFLGFGPLAMPIYWVIHVLPEPVAAS